MECLVVENCDWFLQTVKILTKESVMFYVSFVFDDSSRLSWLVEAPNERSAVNAILNKTKTVKKPKFVVVEKPCITSSDEDIDLLNKFESWDW
jgi:hypothetical protein